MIPEVVPGQDFCDF